LIKKIDFNEQRDNPAINAANSRTLSIYGKQTAVGESTALNAGNANVQKSPFKSTGVEFDKWLLAATEQIEETHSQLISSGQELENSRGYQDEYIRDFDNNPVNIQITDDIDDEAILGRNRHRKKQARTNTR